MTTVKELLKNLEKSRNLRHIPSQVMGKCLDLSGNDYLGLAQEASSLEEEFMDSHRDSPLLFTSAASRLLSTRQDSHLAFEESLEKEYRRPALLFNSGYHANTGIIGSLASLPETVFLADKLVHASIIDGLRLSGAEFYRFRHNDINALSKLIGRHEARAQRIIVVTESVFSMDGDRTPLEELVKLRQNSPKLILYIDEAHAFGVLGPRGLGLTASPEISPWTDIMVGTLGKAGASFGAFTVCSEEMKQWILNTARSFIFSTALPPVIVDWSHFIFEKIITMDARRVRLAQLSECFRETINDFSSLYGDFSSIAPASSTQIVPLITGSSEAALSLSSHLRDSGILALPIRRPTVPPGTERIRFSLHALLPDDCPDIIASALKQIS